VAGGWALLGVDAVPECAEHPTQTLVDLLYACAELKPALSDAQRDGLLRRLQRHMGGLAPSHCPTVMVRHGPLVLPFLHCPILKLVDRWWCFQTLGDMSSRSTPAGLHASALHPLTVVVVVFGGGGVLNLR
jgi:hypothetical protein